MAHTLRQVDKDFTFDEQRVEINELAVDVYNLKHDLGDITLNDIEDVNVGAKSTWVPGNIIKWDGTEWTTDIDVSGITLTVAYNPTTYDPVGEKRGDISYNGSTGVFTWTPPDHTNFLTELGSIGGHTDVDVTTTAPADGNVLKWDSSVGTGGSWVPDTDSVGVTYSIEALASPGIQLLNDGNAQASNRVFFDGIGAISVDRKTGTTNTIEFSASTFAGESVGLVPASTLAETSKYLKSDGSWDNPPNTEYLAFAGEGVGLVPASTANVSNKFLRSDGSWQLIDDDNNTTYSQSAVIDSVGVKLRLTDSASTPVNDDIVITAGTNITIDQITDAGFRINSSGGGGTADGNDYVTDAALGTGVNAKKLTLSFADTTKNQDVDLSSIDTNTEYELKAIDSSDDIILKLDADSSGTDDQVKIVAGNNITLTHTNEGEFKIDATGGAGGGANVTIATTAPSSPAVGDLWWHSEEGQLKIWYDDNGSAPDTQWVDTGGGGGNAGTGSSTFIGLSDTPGDFTGQSGKFLRVNTGEDGLEYVTGSATDLAIQRSGTLFKVTCNTGTDASLPLADTDNWGLMSDEMFDKLDGINFSTSLTVGAGSGSSTAAGVTLSDGLVSIRTGTGSVAAIDLYCESTNAHKISIKAPAHANFSGNQTFVLPGASGDDGDVLVTDGNGNTSWSTLTDNDTNVFKDLTGTPSAYDDGKYLKSTATGTEWATISTSSSNVTTDDTAPTTPSDGALWWDSNSGNLKVYYQDTDSSAWVDAINVTSNVNTTNTLTSDFGQVSFPRFDFHGLAGNGIYVGDSSQSTGTPGNQKFEVYRGSNKTNRIGQDLSLAFDGDPTTFVELTNCDDVTLSSQSTFNVVFDTPIEDVVEIRVGIDGWGVPGWNGVSSSGTIWDGTNNQGRQAGAGGTGTGRIDAPYEGKIDSAQEVIIYNQSASTIKTISFTAWDDPAAPNQPTHANWSTSNCGDFITNLYYIKIRKTGGELIELTYDRNEDPSALDEYVLDQWEIYGDSSNPQNMPEVLSTPNSNGRNVVRSPFPFELVGGKGMAVDSNGIWTFPSPGVWKLDLNVPYYSTTISTEMHQYLEYTDNDSSWKYISRSEGHLTANQELYLRIQYTLNIKDITKQKIKIYTGGISGSSFYHPSGGGNMVSGFSSPYHVHRGGLTFEKVQRVNTTY